MTDALDLLDTAIQLRDGGSAEPGARRGLAAPGLWTVAAIRADSDQAVHADVWERHPAGDEVLCVLSGAITVSLRDHGDGTEPVVTLRSGQAVVVPTGCWHRLTVSEPADLLALTPRADTQHERVSGNTDSVED